MRHAEPFASPAIGHWGMCPLDFQLFNFSGLYTNSDVRLHSFVTVYLHALYYIFVRHY